jgi:hypothetical protein
MSSLEYWDGARSKASKNRRIFTITSLVWSLPAALSVLFFLYAPQDWDRFILLMSVIVFGLFSFLMIKDTHKRYQKRHQKTVLADLLSNEMPLRVDPNGGISMMMLTPSGLFPTAEKVMTETYIRGSIADHLIEVSSLSLTRLKIRKRGPRKTNKSVFEGACFVMDLGNTVLEGDMHIFGARARRTWAQRRHNNFMVPLLFSGFGLGSRVWGQIGARKIWTKESSNEVKRILKIIPEAQISLFGGRYLLIALPRAGKFFRPAGVLFTPSRDPHVSKILDIMRHMVRLGVILGAEPVVVRTAFENVYGDNSNISVQDDMSSNALLHRKESRFMYNSGQKWGNFKRDLGTSETLFYTVLRKIVSEVSSTYKSLSEKIRHSNIGETVLEKLDSLKSSSKDSPSVSSKKEKENEEASMKVRRIMNDYKK